MSRLEQRVKRMEEEAPQPPCNHPVAVLFDPTEEEVEQLEKELAACPNRHGYGPGPAMVIFLTPRGKP